MMHCELSINNKKKRRRISNTNELSVVDVSMFICKCNYVDI